MSLDRRSLSTPRCVLPKFPVIRNPRGSFHFLKRERLRRWTTIARFPFYLFYPRSSVERAVHIQLYKNPQLNKILSPYQCTFRKCHSTEFAAFSFSDNIRRYMDQGQLTGAVFIDLRKAFDTVDHSVLLDKLSNLGIVDIERGWFNGLPVEPHPSC